jgi:hypothetical protein
MSDYVIEATVCRGCYAVIEAVDNYCRHCGTPTIDVTGMPNGNRAARPFSGELGSASSTQQSRLSESPWVVLPMLFLVLGPLALPLLWRSRRFTLPWKVALSVVMAGMTVFLLWSIWFSLQQSLAPLRELEKLQGF